MIAKQNHITQRLVRALSHSDDYAKYKSVFLKVSEQLIQSGRCEIEDFEEFGGWVRSQNYKLDVIYFTYCGGYNTSYRIYLNPDKQAVFQDTQ